jgi:hypothetical protein
VRREAALAVALIACSSNKLLDATTKFSTLAASTSQQLGRTPRMVAELCRHRVEIHFIATATAEPRITLHAAFDRDLPIANAGDRPTHWREKCARYSLADDGFETGLAALAAYAESLGEIARDDSKVELGGYASAAGSIAGALSDGAALYQPAIAGLGKPLGELATLVLAYWKTNKLGTLVREGDQAFQESLCRLVEFVQLVRNTQLREAREELAAFVRDPRHGAELRYTLAIVEVEMTRRFDRMERRLIALEELLGELGRAHTALKAGWERGDTDAVETIKTLGSLGKELHGSVKELQEPAR